MYSYGLKCTDLCSLSTFRRLIEDDEDIILVDEYVEGDDDDDDIFMRPFRDGAIFNRQGGPVYIEKLV